MLRLTATPPAPAERGKTLLEAKPADPRPALCPTTQRPTSVAASLAPLLTGSAKTAPAPPCPLSPKRSSSPYWLQRWSLPSPFRCGHTTPSSSRLRPTSPRRGASTAALPALTPFRTRVSFATANRRLRKRPCPCPEGADGAPKEQPPRNLAGKVAAGGGRSGKQSAGRSAHRRGKAARRRNLSGPVTEGALIRAEICAKAKPWDPSEHERVFHRQRAAKAYSVASAQPRSRRQDGAVRRL